MWDKITQTEHRGYYFYLIALCRSPKTFQHAQSIVTLCHFKEKHFEEIISKCLLQYIIIPGGYHLVVSPEKFKMWGALQQNREVHFLF